MKLILEDKNNKQRIEVLILQFKGNLITGIMLSNSFNIEFKKEISKFEDIVNTQQFSILDEVAHKIDLYGWNVSKEGWEIFDFQVFNKDISFRISNLNSYLGECDVYAKLETLGYDNRWFIYNYLTIEELNIQYRLYNKAITNSESLEFEKGYQHTEHLRYGQFWKISEEHKNFSDKQLEELIELVEADEDEVMSKNFYRDILNKKKVTLEQIIKYKELQEL